MSLGAGIAIGLMLGSGHSRDNDETQTQQPQQSTEDKCRICGDIMIMVDGRLQCKNCGHDRTNGA